MTKPIASISLDLDNLWSYQKTHGDPDWVRLGSYFPQLMPPLLDALDRVGCKITFFVVGADAVREENADALRSITARGHEVGNHSFEHDCWLHALDRSALASDIARAEDAIVAATGQRPSGFRGPGFSWSPTLFEVLAERGYQYDASTLPTYLAPVARAYFLWTARLTPEERKLRKGLFGSFRDGLRPVKPYAWRLSGGRRLLEIPVTTMPIVKVPFHLSYLLYLSRASKRGALAYLRAALALCRVTGTTPSFLLHPLDLLGGDQVSQLSFFPGMELPSARKAAFVEDALQTIAREFALVPMSVHAAAALATPQLDVRNPVLAT